MSKTGTAIDPFVTIERLRSYTEFESVTVSRDGSVSVKYAVRSEKKNEDKKPDKPRKTAIDSLSETAPVFPFKVAK